MKQFPFIPPDLIKALEEAFPDKLPRDPAISQAIVASQIGRQQVIDFLKTRLAAQQRTDRNI